ncbi:hypothetical protein SAMN05192539_10655 [Paraburkholderia diazotrophica]|uniref:SGNH domain-containing protein n=1 Tax=Paraburkholderia diazotrophica TaxID=667676 RepID=A0A1H7EGY9_9BURK|nr:hypothetical protein SAMN05192539_10655 [Paraburkholderia diazotrophica]
MALHRLLANEGAVFIGPGAARADPSDAEAAQERSSLVDIMHTYDVPCTASVCSLNFDGLPIYRFDDYHHLSAAGSSLLFPKYMERHPQELKQVLSR